MLFTNLFILIKVAINLKKTIFKYHRIWGYNLIVSFFLNFLWSYSWTCIFCGVLFCRTYLFSGKEREREQNTSIVNKREREIEQCWQASGTRCSAGIERAETLKLRQEQDPFLVRQLCDKLSVRSPWTDCRKWTFFFPEINPSSLVSAAQNRNSHCLRVNPTLIRRAKRGRRARRVDSEVLSDIRDIQSRT